jgi:RNA polymerase sigma factor (sigma-70 family)
MRPLPLGLDGDARLLDRIRRGDEAALVTLYGSSRRPVRAHVLRNSGTPEEADELLHEALVILWERVRTGRFTLEAKLETFVVATVRNLWLRRLARKRREPAAEPDPDTGDPDALSALDRLIEDEAAAGVHRALSRLGEPCRSLFLLFYWEELPLEEIAGRLGYKNVDTVKSKKYQCKKELERLLITAANGHE